MLVQDTFFDNCEVRRLLLLGIFSQCFELKPLPPPPFFHFNPSSRAGSDHPRTELYLRSDLGNVILGWMLERMRTVRLKFML